MKFLLVLAVLTFAATAAKAATVFDLTGNGKWATSYRFSEDGIGLTAFTGRQDGSAVSKSSSDWLYQQNRHGLGLYSPGNRKNKEMDGKQINEIVQFYFDQSVHLVSVTFSKVDSNDDFDFYFDTGSGLTEIDDDIDILRNGRYSFLDLWTGTHFGFGADGRDDNFTIRKIEVAAISNIPLPAALPLYGTGLALMGYLGWRRRRNDTPDT
ncbi:MAG: VPLPA-CTERM sorting domain-containing protein [Sneathiella sp.]